jgi:hypothetical protein
MPPAWLRLPGEVAPAHRRAPADVHDDPEAMQQWAGLAVEAGLRGAAKKPPRKHKAQSRP